MSKHVKKQPWYERLAEIDARQEATIAERNKAESDDFKRGVGQANFENETFNVTIKMSRSARVTFLVLTIALPFLAWAIGALINPSGWLSDSPLAAFTLVAYFPFLYWYITLPILVGVFYFLVIRKSAAMILFLFIISILLSVFTALSTATAADSEFTG